MIASGEKADRKAIRNRSWFQHLGCSRGVRLDAIAGWGEQTCNLYVCRNRVRDSHRDRNLSQIPIPQPNGGVRLRLCTHIPNRCRRRNRSIDSKPACQDTLLRGADERSEHRLGDRGRLAQSLDTSSWRLGERPPRRQLAELVWACARSRRSNCSGRARLGEITSSTGDTNDESRIVSCEGVLCGIGHGGRGLHRIFRVVDGHRSAGVRGRFSHAHRYDAVAG